MGSSFLLSFLLIACVIYMGHCQLGTLYEFGHDSPDLQIVAATHGNIGYTERQKVIPLQVTICYTVEYVKVVVKNSLSNPKVTFDPQNFSVSITYGPLQVSKSSYTVYAKGLKTKECY